jgi:hypothetical protein
MVRGQRSIIGTPEAELHRSSPEDMLMTLEAALRALPEIERQVDSNATVTVPAVAEDSVKLGEFLITPNGDNYVISSFTIAHEDGKPCPPTE